MGRVAISFRQLGVIALNTLRQAMRQRVFTLAVLLGLLVVGGAQCLRDFHFGSPELKFIADLGLGTIAAFGAILAVVMTTQLFFDEIEHQTVQTLLAKPVGRAEFILGKLLAVGIILAAFCCVLGVVLGAVLWLRERSLLQEWPDGPVVGPSINYVRLAVLGLLQWLKLLVVASLTLLVASYARTPLFTVVISFVIFLICHLQHIAAAVRARTGISAVGRMVGGVTRCFPDFQLFQLADSVDGNEVGWWGQFGRIALYGLGYVGAAGILAVFSFRRREL